MRLSFSHNLNTTTKILFLKRLALYLRAGMSLPRGLGFIIADSNDTSSRSILTAIESAIASGSPLSKSFAAFPQVFDRFFIGYIEAGESSGTLPETLERLALILEKQQALQKKLLAASLYPSIVLVGTFGMAAFLTLYIFPKILPIFQEMHARLPLTARVLIGAENLITRHLVSLLLLGLLSGAGVAFAFRTSSARLRLEVLLINTPLFGTLYRDYVLSHFLGVSASLLQSGISIIPTLALTRSITPGMAYGEALIDIERRTTEGQRLSSGFARHERLFPPLIPQMIAVGEMTGKLRENLDTLAHLYEDEFDDLTRNLTVLVEPILMLCLGLVVGFIALAIITPIYQLTQSLNVSP
ncbi:MAG: type II secretion system F family protein [Candidatus Pacebacteria bacterium]|nr:type II secretion system F family protein [Candidatus Paceibacterota bacterium]